jgi:hypothetical protein
MHRVWQGSVTVNRRRSSRPPSQTAHSCIGATSPHRKIVPLQNVQLRNSAVPSRSNVLPPLQTVHGLQNGVALRMAVTPIANQFKVANHFAVANVVVAVVDHGTCLPNCVGAEVSALAIRVNIVVRGAETAEVQPYLIVCLAA